MSLSTKTRTLKYWVELFRDELSCNYPKDSGSPLIVEDPDNDRNIQIGIVYGSLEECNDLNYPSLFARLDDYEVLKFIRATAFGDNIPAKVKGNTQ